MTGNIDRKADCAKQIIYFIVPHCWQLVDVVLRLVFRSMPETANNHGPVIFLAAL